MSAQLEAQIELAHERVRYVLADLTYAANRLNGQRLDDEAREAIADVQSTLRLVLS